MPCMLSSVVTVRLRVLATIIFESLFIAAGMMYSFGILFDFFKVQKTSLNLSIYAAITDVLFRHFRLFPSLDGYYNALTSLESIIWAIIPANLPLLRYKRPNFAMSSGMIDKLFPP